MQAVRMPLSKTKTNLLLAQLVLIPLKPSIKLLTFSYCLHILQLVHLLCVADGVQTNHEEEAAEVGGGGGRDGASEETHIFL